MIKKKNLKLSEIEPLPTNLGPVYQGSLNVSNRSQNVKTCKYNLRLAGQVG